MKPVALVAKGLRNSSNPGALVYDPFLGSGTTLVAATQEGRVCYGMEIDPAYVDVIVARWEGLTGQTAIRPTREPSAAHSATSGHSDPVAPDPTAAHGAPAPNPAPDAWPGALPASAAAQ
jgi:hypothetical protein